MNELQLERIVPPLSPDSNQMYRSIATKWLSVFALSFAFITAFSSVAICQDKLDRALAEGGIFETKEQFRQFVKELKQLRDPVVNSMLSAVEDVAMGRKIRDSVMKRNPSLRLLNSKAVRAELEMVDSQYEEMKDLSVELQQTVAEKIHKVDFESAEDTAKQLHEIHEFSKSELESVFLPHQQERLRQVQFQLQMKRKNILGMLTSEPIVSELNISDTQVDKLLQSAKEINEELERKVEQLRKQAQDKLLANLEQEQRDRLNDLIGEPLALSPKLSKDKASNKEDKAKRKKDKPKKEKLENKKAKIKD